MTRVFATNQTPPGVFAIKPNINLSILENRKINESFGWILLNSKLICVIGTIPTYLGIWGKRVNFGNTIAEIQQK